MMTVFVRIRFGLVTLSRLCVRALIENSRDKIVTLLN